MNLKRVIAFGGLIVAGFATPVLADSYYVVRDVTTKKCTVVREKPTTTTTTIVGDDAVYTSESDADVAMKKTTICTSQ